MKEKNEQQKAHISPELVAKAKAGDQQAFTELYMQTNTALYRSIRSMVHNDDTAWDIEQETYLKAFQNLHKLEHNEAFLPWLRRISVHVTATEMSKRLPMNFTDLGDEDGDLPEQVDLSIDTQPELALDQKESSRLVREILAELPEQQHLILGMRYYEDLSVKEICELLHLAPSTVKTQLSRGRKHVEERVRTLEQKGIKLYGLSPMAFLLALMRRAEPAKQAAMATGKAVAAKALGEGAAVGATNVAVSSAGRVLAGKLVAGALSLALIGGGIWGGAKLLRHNEDNDPPYQPLETIPVEITQAPEPLDPFACGEDLRWEYDEEKQRLTITGSGPMFDYDAAGSQVPWYDHREAIRQVELPEALTRVGSYAFRDCTALDKLAGSNDAVIGQGAFQGCTALSLLPHATPAAIEAEAFKDCRNLKWIQLSDGLTALGDGAFSGCPSLTELWVLNENCQIGADLATDSQVTIYGLPGSTAEQYAQENGYAFGLIEEDREAVEDFLEEAGNDPMQYAPARVAGVVASGEGYLVKILKANPLEATEEELQQARQSGTITLAGTVYQFTGSEEQARAWDNNTIDASYYEDAVAWIRDEATGQNYNVLEKEEGVYRFVKTVFFGGEEARLVELQVIGWIRLDADTQFSTRSFGGDTTLEGYLAHGVGPWPWDWDICSLRMQEDGKFQMVWETSGKR